QGEVTRYCESSDGIHWHAPRLGLVVHEGTVDNNIVLNEPPFSHNFSPFLDANPKGEPGERYEALAGLHRTGLVAFGSADGIHWRKAQSTPVIPAEVPWESPKLFDSQNVSFWSDSEGCYVCYFRTEVNGLRRIARM